MAPPKPPSEGPRRGGGRPAKRVPDSPLDRERARETLHAALDRGNDAEVAANAALRVSPECVEALLLLADTAVSADEARQRVRRAVETATWVLGEAGLRDGRGHLSDTPDGAAYLHALAALARGQIAEDRAAQAIQTLTGILAMDPRDPIPVRGDLLLLLLATGRDDEAQELVDRFPEESASAEWSFARALLRRRRALDEAAVERATAALDRAVARFPDLARALAGLPSSGPKRGASDGADPVLRSAVEDTEGATEWLRARIALAQGRAPPPPPPKEDPEADRRFSAREHVAEAADAEGGRRESLARRALELWPDCAEAWRLLATVVRTPEERVRRLREAVAAGRRALRRAPDAAPAPLGEGEDARTALEVRRDLAQALREIGRDADALVEERALLAEDPDDVLRAGPVIVARWLALGLDADAAPLLAARAEDASPAWAWLRVLAHRRAGERVPMSFALGEATLVAPLVAPFLLAGRTRLPRPLEASADAYDQAKEAADAIREAWEATPGALAWLRGTQAPPRPDTRGRPPGPGRTS